MYALELTDKYILLYNSKTNKLIKEPIPYNIIKDNKIYDIQRLNKTLLKIIDKHKVLNTFYKVNINILIYEKITPSESYIVKNILKNISNINLKIIHPSSYFDTTHLLISGEKIYNNNKEIKEYPKEEYILVGYTENYDKIINEIKTKNKTEIYKYENSKQIIFDKIFYLLLIILIV